MTRTTSPGERIEHEGRVRDDGLSPSASIAVWALLSLVVSLVLGLWRGQSLRTCLAMAALAWTVLTVADLLRRRQRVSITASAVVIRTWYGRTVGIPTESVAHVMHLRTGGARGGLLSLLDEQDVPLCRFWTQQWPEETVAALLAVGRRSTVEDVPPEEDVPVWTTARTRRARRAAALVLHGLLVAFSVVCLVSALLLIALAWSGAV